MSKYDNVDKALDVSPVLIALVKSLNDGTFVPGSGYTLPEIKQIIKNNL